MSVVVFWILVTIAGRVVPWFMGEFQERDIAYLILQVALLIPLVWRRSNPFTVMLIVMVPSLISALSSDPVMATSHGVAYILILFNVGMRCPNWQVTLTFILINLNGLIDSITTNHGYIWTIVADITSSLVIFGLILTVALLLRTKRDHVVWLEQQQAEQSATEERHRIAREMHDIIGHNLAVVNALADGGQYAAKAGNHDGATQALESISDTSRQALNELRRVLGVLRHDDEEEAEIAPQPGLDDIDELIQRVRSTGRNVNYRTHGERPELNQGHELVIYRTIQEAMTNALKHTPPGTPMTIEFEYGSDDVDLRISNPGILVDNAQPGRGLSGLAERARAFGGTMESGPSATGGWTVTLHLPVNGN